VLGLTFTLILSAFNDLDPAFDFAAVDTPTVDAALGMLEAEVVMVLAVPELLPSSTRAIIDSAGAFVFVPSFVSHVKLPYNLGAGYTAAFPANSTQQPLLMDLTTVAAVLMGDVQSWLDPRLVALNPWLTRAFNSTADAPTTAANAPSATIRLYLCCNAHTAVQSGKNSRTRSRRPHARRSRCFTHRLTQCVLFVCVGDALQRAV
jgi:hypothetical protein